MFETVGTLLNEINIFDSAIYLAVLGIIFGASRGISKGNKEQTLLWAITLGIFSTLLIFREDVIKGGLFLTTALIMIIYGITKLGVNRPEE